MIFPARRQVAMVGIDGFSPQFLERYMADGAMPALRALAERGVCVPLISTFPATTPVAWSAMSTGCHPSTNGIEGFLLHRLGRSFDNRISGIYVDQMTAEPIWQTAHLHGLASFVVKFPVSYPSNTAALRIDGAAGWGGITCLHEVAASGASVWQLETQRELGKATAVGLGIGPERTIRESDPWVGRPAMGRLAILYGVLALANIWGHAPTVVHLAVCSVGEGFSLFIAKGPDWSSDHLELMPSQWSEPFILSAVNRRGALTPCALRFKLIELSGDPIRLRLFNTPLHELDGHSSPNRSWQIHRQQAGPIEEQTDPTLLFSGAIDIATHMERCRLNIDWLRKVSQSILDTERWDLFMVQTHIVDWAHHILHGAVDPRHPLYDPARADEAEALLRLSYSMADTLIASVISAAGSDANVVVMGDHGQDLHHTTVRLNQWLADLGYFVFQDKQGPAIDWERTLACVLGNGLYLNVKGRDPYGIVEPGSQDTLIDELSDRLRRLTDPRTGQAVMRIVGTRRDFAYIGGHGKGTGDIVFALNSGYQARNDCGALFELTRPWTEFTSGHDHFWPLDPRLESRLYAAGPAFVRAGQTRLRPIVDVAPTLAAILGIDMPDGIDGVSINDILSARREPSQYMADPFQTTEFQT